MKKSVYEEARRRALELYEKAHIVLTPEEQERLEVADFGLGRLEDTGLEIVTYVHRHAPVEEIHYPGKEETFRCRYGTCYVYIEGEPTADPVCQPPKGCEEWYTVWHQVVLRPGQQLTMTPDTRHWFQAGPEGAVVSEFSPTA